MSSREACERLGVRPQTLYAYVSRDLLHPRKDGRRSRFAVDELDALATRARRTARPGRLEVLIDTELTLLDPNGRLCYRGVDVEDIAGRWSFERTAEWLWTGVDAGEPQPWPVPDPPDVPVERPAGRIRAAAAFLAASAGAPYRAHDDVAGTGRRLVPRLVGALPARGDEAGTGTAARLHARLADAAPTLARLRAVEAALVLLADHELAASTVAARVAASTWAPPLDCVVAAMAVHAGALHGGISSEVEDAVRHGRRLTAGFGHAVYRGRDPRADALLPLVRAASPAKRWRLVERALGHGDHPNVDLAVAALAVGLDLVPGAAEAIFVVARVPGWLAHAAEEHGRPFRFRPTASYVGLRPQKRIRLNP